MTSTRHPLKPGAHPSRASHASAEAVRDAHVKPSSRTRHAVGNAAQADTPAAGRDADGGDWMAEAITPARRPGSKENR